jgi:hypothetical protein
MDCQGSSTDLLLVGDWKKKGGFAETPLDFRVFLGKIKTG